MLSQQPFLIRLRHNIVRFLCEGLNNIFVPVAYQSSSSRVSKKSKFFFMQPFSVVENCTRKGPYGYFLPLFFRLSREVINAGAIYFFFFFFFFFFIPRSVEAVCTEVV